MSDNVEWLTCVAQNVKAGITKHGNQYRRFGLKTMDGKKVLDDRGQSTMWVNYFRVVTEKTASYYKKDCAAMGVTNDDPAEFKCDGRKVTVKYGKSDYSGKMDVLGVYPYDANKATSTPETVAGVDDLPF